MSKAPELTVIEGGDSIKQPDWDLIYNEADEIEQAREYWNEIVGELKQVGTLAQVNAAAIERMVDLRLIYDQARRVVVDKGFIIYPHKKNPRAIARISPHWGVMLDANSALERAEGELGLSPRRRGAVTKVDKKTRTKQAADAYLSQVPK